MDIDGHFDNDKREEFKEITVSESEETDTKKIFDLEDEHQSTTPLSDSEPNQNFEIDSVQNNSIISEVFQFDNEECKKRIICILLFYLSWTNKIFASIIDGKNKWC